MGYIPKYFEQVFPICTLRCCSKTKRKFGMKIRHNFSVGVCRTVMTFIYYEISEIIWSEIIKILGYTLNSGTNGI